MIGLASFPARGRAYLDTSKKALRNAPAFEFNRGFDQTLGTGGGRLAS
jgi:hypothetical protein